MRIKTTSALSVASILALATALIPASSPTWAHTQADTQPGRHIAWVGGTTPSVRPPGAPVVRQFDKPAGWYTKALTGVVPPYPGSLRFLEDQANWYTPFDHPGMIAPYDLRNLHKP